MISRRISTTLRAILLLLPLLAASAAVPLASSSSVEPTNARSLSSTNRWLTYGCNSKSGYGRERRGLLRGRILIHPCSSHAKQSTANEVYNKNSTYHGSNTFLNVTLGIISGVAAILGLIFLIDRETFEEVTGVKEVHCKCTKPNIDQEEDDELEPSPFEKDNYHLTKDTQDYLAEKKDMEEEKPMRILKQYFACFFRTKKYNDDDKYDVPWTGDENNPGKVNAFLVFWEDIRLRFCWRPTKKYQDKNCDKYAVNGDPQVEDEIKYAASSYESAEKGTTPW